MKVLILYLFVASVTFRSVFCQEDFLALAKKCSEIKSEELLHEIELGYLGQKEEKLKSKYALLKCYYLFKLRKEKDLHLFVENLLKRNLANYKFHLKNLLEMNNPKMKDFISESELNQIILGLCEVSLSVNLIDKNLSNLKKQIHISGDKYESSFLIEDRQLISILLKPGKYKLFLFSTGILTPIGEIDAKLWGNITKEILIDFNYFDLRVKKESFEVKLADRKLTLSWATNLDIKKGMFRLKIKSSNNESFKTSQTKEILIDEITKNQIIYDLKEFMDIDEFKSGEQLEVMFLLTYYNSIKKVNQDVMVHHTYPLIITK